MAFLALALFSLSLSSPTMRFTDAATALFSDGIVGQQVIDQRRLPIESFPAAGTWNQFPSLSAEEKANLRYNSFFAPPPVAGNKSKYHTATRAAKLQSFLTLNAGAVRFSADHRVWTARDIYGLHQRTTFGCSLVVIRVPLENGTTSEPLLVVAGPMATLANGPTYDTRDVFDLPPDGPLPVLHPTASFPAVLAPTSISLAADPRAWIPSTETSQLPATARTKGLFLTIPDSSALHSTIMVYDALDTIHPGLNNPPEFRGLGLWVPIDQNSDESADPDPDTMDKWFRSSPVPPDPRTTPLLDTASTTPLPTREPYRPNAGMTVELHPDDGDVIETTAGYMLLPRFLRFPPAVILPVGLVLDPKRMTGEAFRKLIAFLGGDTALLNTSWMSNVLLDTWFAAVAANPDPFAAQAFPHSVMESAMSVANTTLLNMRLHLEMSLTQQLIWDHAFATAPKVHNTLSRLTKYANALVAAYNIADDDTALASTMGFIDSVFRHPFLTLLRPCTKKTFGSFACHLSGLLDLPETDLPSDIIEMPMYHVEVPIKTTAVVTCPPFLTRPDPDLQPLRLNPDDDAEDSADGEDQHQRSTTSIRSTSSRRRSTTALFWQQPETTEPPEQPPKRHRSEVPPTAPDTATTTTSVPHTRSTSPCLVFDPESLRAISGHSAQLFNPWALPAFLPGQAPLPIPPGASPHSAALSCALRQSTPPNIPPGGTTPGTPGATPDNQVTFGFSRDLMLSYSAFREFVNRGAFWGSYRCALPEDPPVLNNGAPSLPYQDDYLMVPGRFNPDLIVFLKAAHQKSPNSPAFASLTNWYEMQCAAASPGARGYCRGLDCRIQHGFFTPHVVQALQSFAFTAGLLIQSTEEPTSLLTPWHFIRSIPDFKHAPDNRIPSDGLKADQIHDVIGNIVFVFHLHFRCFMDFPQLGRNHSTFSRFSPLAGHLLLLASQFRDRGLSDHWDTSLSPTTRLTLTKAVFIAVAQLFDTYETWMFPKQDPSTTFLTARVGSHTNLVLLSPTIDEKNTRLPAFFLRWRQEIDVFSLQRLQCELPRDGFFAQPTPICFLPRASPAHQLTSHTPSAPSSVVTFESTLPTQQSSRSTQSRSSLRSSGSNTVLSGESSRAPKRATVPLVAGAARGTLAPFAQTLAEINQGLTDETRIRVPSFALPTARNRKRSICWRFCAADGDGCTRGANCTFHHLDLANRSWVVENVPSAFLRDLLAFIDKPAISRHYRATPELRNFLSQR